MQRVPSGSARPPVVLLNGWETGITGTCPVSGSSVGYLWEPRPVSGVRRCPDSVFLRQLRRGSEPDHRGVGQRFGRLPEDHQVRQRRRRSPRSTWSAFSMGGLIARSYLAGLQPDRSQLRRRRPPWCGKLILIATPNFGSFVAGNYIYSLPARNSERRTDSSAAHSCGTWPPGINAATICAV